ncbi:helix-turn-helix domain-containing protein [Amycolatopsis sp. NPDC089917]|uniref:helix-turn-helix domain-containing protein n=1 Tax=Amycolatopsis sp. NPDC089917 TaxID=3155187 RepID=UPI0034363FF2
MIRRILLTLLAGAAVLLVPWTVYLAHTLPDRYDTGQWRAAWVGFDVALLLCFAAGAWLGLRRRRAAVPLLSATAAMLCCDAWFDVMLGWTSAERWASVALAVFVEIPVAVLLALAARRLLSSAMPKRSVTLRDIAIREDPRYQRVAKELPADADEIAGRTGLARAEVAECLETLQDNGFVRRDRKGTWISIQQDLREPRPDDYDGADRERVAAFLDAKYANELALLSWAAQHRDEFGPWSTAQRTSTRLTEEELRELDAEYRELITRYCQRRRRPAADEKELSVRFYAFPPPETVPS